MKEVKLLNRVQAVLSFHISITLATIQEFGLKIGVATATTTRYIGKVFWSITRGVKKLGCSNILAY